MSNLSYLVIHCSATPEGMSFNGNDIRQWHLSPRDLDDGRVKYKGEIYESRYDLPEESINGIDIAQLEGRGWDRVGYSDLILLDGFLENLTPFNQDNKVDPWEVTWGAKGVNYRSRHICYIGGLREEVIDDHFEPADTRTPEQIYAMATYVKYMTLRHPDIKIAGHTDFTNKKSCPCFDVKKWCRGIGLLEHNI